MSHSKDMKDRLVEAEKLFKASLDHPTHRSWRANAAKCHAYKEGSQWTAEELKELRRRNQPDTVNNQIRVTVSRLVGSFIGARMRTTFRGRNTPEDDKISQVLTDLFLYIRNNTDLEFEEREMVEDGFTGGMGVLETWVEFDEVFEPEIKIKYVDAFDVFPDPLSRRYDWNEDASYICKAPFVPVEKIVEMYPDKSADIKSAGNSTSGQESGELAGVDQLKNNNFIDPNRPGQLRLVECWKKKEIRENFAIFPDGKKILVENLTPEQKTQKHELITRSKTKMQVVIFTHGILLEEKEIDRDRFSMIPFYVFRKKSGEPYSSILVALPMQDAINKREGKSLHLLNSNQAIYEQGTVKDKVQFAQEMARPDGQMEVTSLAGLRIEKNIDLAATQFSMHNEAKADFRRITGVNPDALGEKTAIRSGIGIARKQAMTDTIIAPDFDNIRRTRKALGKTVLELVQKFMTSKKVVTITDDLNAPKQITLNEDADAIKALKESKYDVIIEDKPDVSASHQEQFQTISQMLPQLVGLPPIWTELLIQMSDIRDKDAILEKIKAQTAPTPNLPKMSVTAQISELSAPERAFFYNQMGSPELAQALVEEDIDPAHIVRAKTEMAKAEIVSEDKDKQILNTVTKDLSGGQANGQGNNNTIQPNR